MLSRKADINFSTIKDESFEKLYEESLKDVKEGQIVKGKIIEVRPKEVLVDIGYKSEGVISLEEFSSPEAIKVGDEIEVFLESKESDDGCVVISKKKADRSQGWERIVSNFKEGDIISGRVSKRTKGGFLVDIGIEAFLPASLVSPRAPVSPSQLLGQTFNFKIVKMNKPRKNVVLSRKDVIQKEKEQQKAKLLESLQIGEVRSGVVKNITDFGAFINLGGVDGLLHITDMSWERISHPSEILAIGDKIDVVILGFDKENMKISLGLKQKSPSPWQDVDKKYPVGSRIKGRVTNIMPYGAFVELEKGIEGLVHISELSWIKKINHPSEVLAIGDVIEAVVLNIDKDNQKISLGIKQIEPNPWLDIEKGYSQGTAVKGKVRTLTDQGAIIELEDGIEGFIHLDDISWVRKPKHPKELLKRGQKIDAVVLSVDANERKISLGMKQLTTDPWPEIAKKYSIGSNIEATVTKITSFGIFVELEKDIEGLIHISELPITPPKTIEESFKVGDKVKAKVIKVDDEQRKIALSVRDLEITGEPST